MSYGIFSFTEHFFAFQIDTPHVTSAWLAPRDSLNLNGFVNDTQLIQRERQIAISSINNLTDIHFDIDADGNNVVDSVTIIFRGLGGES